MHIHLSRRGASTRDVRAKLQTLALVMVVGTLTGFVLHSLAAAPGKRTAFADMAFATAAKLGSVFDMGGGTAIAALATLVVIGLVISAIPVDTRRDA